MSVKVHAEQHRRVVAVTGGAGFIGSHLCRRLLENGNRVRCIDNLHRGAWENLGDCASQVELVTADLRNLDQTLEALMGADVVYHLASIVGGIGVYIKHASTVWLDNTLIDQNVFRAVIQNRISRLFYASSGHVYPEALQQTPSGPDLLEDMAYPAQPGLSYGWAKLMGEKSLGYLLDEHQWLHVALARIVGAYGPNQDIDLDTGAIIPVLCHRAARWPDLQPFRVWGTGQETRSYIFIDDVIDAFVRAVDALEHTRCLGPFNLGNHGRVTISRIVDTVVSVSGKPIDVFYDTAVATRIWGQAADTALARRLLSGWAPRVSLEDGISRVYEDVARRVAQREGHA